MSLYRKMLVAVAGMCLAGAVFADDMNTTSTTTTQPADTSMQQTTTTSTTTTTDKLDINTATAKQLMKIKGINSARAHAIVKYRAKHGNFKSLDELREVKGFKKLHDDKMQDIESQLTAG